MTISGVAQKQGSFDQTTFTVPKGQSQQFYALPTMQVEANGVTFSQFDTPAVPSGTAPNDAPYWQMFTAFGVQINSDLSDHVCETDQPVLSGLISEDGSQELAWTANCTYSSNSLANIVFTGVTSIVKPPDVSKEKHPINPIQYIIVGGFFFVIAIIVIVVLVKWKR